MSASRLLPLCAALAAAAPLAPAQSFQFQIDQGASAYTWSGTTSLGTLQGNPSNAFALSGTIDISLQSGGNPIGGGQWLSSNAMAAPDLSAVIPNPVFFLPPLATVDITNLSFSMSSTPFTCDASGAFTTTTTITMLTGTLTVTPLAGSQTITDLAGTPGPPTLTSGTLTSAGGVLSLNSPQNTNFQFTDPTSGISADLSLNGTLAASFVCPPVSNYCTTSPNSVGAGVVATTTGSTSISANNLVLIGNNGPSNFFGIFFYGGAQIAAPFGDGIRCVGAGGGPLYRLPPVNSGPSGVFTTALNHGSLPGAISAGETWNFQCWYRDPQGGSSGFNLSDGLEIFFCP
jgi:hypothetical protein